MYIVEIGSGISPKNPRDFFSAPGKNPANQVVPGYPAACRVLILAPTLDGPRSTRLTACELDGNLDCGYRIEFFPDK
jgi:hypothetical protein